MVHMYERMYGTMVPYGGPWYTCTIIGSYVRTRVPIGTCTRTIGTRVQMVFEIDYVVPTIDTYQRHAQWSTAIPFWYAPEFPVFCLMFYLLLVRATPR
jgi:hypothetical protein